MDRQKSSKKAHSKNNDNELDLTLRLSLPAGEEEITENQKPRLHDFLHLGGGGNSNNEVPNNRYSDVFGRQHGRLPTTDWSGLYTYNGGSPGLLVAPLHPIVVPTIRCNGSTLSSHDQGFLPSTGFATPSRKRPTNEHGRICRSCGTNNSRLWRKGPDGPQTLCNKCGLKHSRHLKKGLH